MSYKRQYIWSKQEEDQYSKKGMSERDEYKT